MLTNFQKKITIRRFRNLWKRNFRFQDIFRSVISLVICILDTVDIPRSFPL